MITAGTPATATPCSARMSSSEPTPGAMATSRLKKVAAMTLICRMR